MKTSKDTVDGPIYRCRDCKLGTPDLKPENMSITGQPTLIICSLRPWPKHVVTELACENFQLR